MDEAQSPAAPGPGIRTWLVLTPLVFLLLFSRNMTRELDSDEQLFVAPPALVHQTGLTPYIDFPYFHMPNLLLVYAWVTGWSPYKLLAAHADLDALRHGDGAPGVRGGLAPARRAGGPPTLAARRRPHPRLRLLPSLHVHQRPGLEPRHLRPGHPRRLLSLPTRPPRQRPALPGRRRPPPRRRRRTSPQLRPVPSPFHTAGVPRSVEPVPPPAPNGRRAGGRGRDGGPAAGVRPDGAGARPLFLL